MAKKRSHVGTVYFVTIFITILLVGGLAYFIMYNVIINKDDPADSKIDSGTESGSFVPTEEHNQTILLILDGGSAGTDRLFVLARFLPTDSKLILVPLPNETIAQVGTTRNTLYEYFRTGGSAQAVQAVQSATGITVDRYMRLTKDNCAILLNMFGNLDYVVPYDLIYENKATGEATIIKQGLQTLEGNAIRKIVTYPLYENGEEYRMKIAGSLLTELINNAMTEGFKDNLDDNFNTVVNTIDTNFTRFDYDLRREAIRYVIEPHTSPAQFMIVFGDRDGTGALILSDGCLKLMKEKFGLETDTLATGMTSATVTAVTAVS